MTFYYFFTIKYVVNGRFIIYVVYLLSIKESKKLPFDPIEKSI